MSRLVDIEDVKNFINGLDSLPWEEEIDELLEIIPTAYDVEKVVAELKEKKDEASIEAGKRSVRIGEDEYEEEPYYEGKKHAYGHAIEMVRKGGAE